MKKKKKKAKVLLAIFWRHCAGIVSRKSAPPIFFQPRHAAKTSAVGAVGALIWRSSSIAATQFIRAAPGLKFERSD